MREARTLGLIVVLLLGCGGAVQPGVAPTGSSTPSASVPPASTPRARVAPTVCGTGLASGPAAEALEGQARAAGLEHPDAFAGVAWTVHTTGRLPDCYLTKREAADVGWERGRPVWQVRPGHSIGGDRFGNREGLLPEPQPGGYREADLDDDGGRRGAHRLVFAERTKGRWDLWITTDHYRSFTGVEAP